jgi:hypothetical protein
MLSSGPEGEFAQSSHRSPSTSVETQIPPSAPTPRTLHSRAAVGTRLRRRVRINRRTQYVIAVLLAVFPIGYGLFGLHLGQDIGFDTLNYHYFDPYWLLSDHFSDILPAQEQTFLSPLLNIPTYLLQRSLPARSASFLIAAVEGTAVVPLYLIARRVTTTRAVALVLAVLGMFGAIAWSEIGTSFGDNLVAIPLLSSIALIGRYLGTRSNGQDANGWLLVAAGVASGIGCGLKLAEAPIALGFLVAIPLLDGAARFRILASLKYLGGAVLGTGVAYGYWAYELASHFGNPFLPFFNNIFHSKYAPLAGNTDTRFLPHNAIDLVFYPLLWAFHPLRVNEVNFRELSLPLCELLLFVAIILRLFILVRTKRWRALFPNEFERFVAVGASVSVLVWAGVFSVYRYLTTIEMLGFVLLWILTKSILDVIAPVAIRPRVFAAAMVIICLICVGTEQPANFGRAGFAAKYFTVSVPKQFRGPNNAVLMLSGDPYAYMVPFLPRSTDVIRLEGNLLPTPYVNTLIAERLKRASTIYITWMSVERRRVFLAQNAVEWEQFGLQVVAKSCSVFSTRRGDERGWVRFCQVARLKRSSSTTT